MIPAAFPDHYATLQIREDATPAEIEQAYLRLCRRAPGVWEQLVRWVTGRHGPALDAAFGVLIDPPSRRAYDRALRLYRFPHVATPF